MVPLSVVVCFALLALAVATEVQQCQGQSFDALSERVQLSPCKKIPCKLKKGTDQHITIKFTAEKDLEEIKTHVTADVFGVPVPFVGVDGTSVCSKLLTETGETASCPLTAGNTYVYKDSFPVLSFYPTLNTKVHWALQSGDKDVTCFEVPVKIVA